MQICHTNPQASYTTRQGVFSLYEIDGYERLAKEMSGRRAVDAPCGQCPYSLTRLNMWLTARRLDSPLHSSPGAVARLPAAVKICLL